MNIRMLYRTNIRRARRAQALIAGAGLLLLATGVHSGAVYDPAGRIIYVQGPDNTLLSIAEDLQFPDFFCYDFAARVAECAVDIVINGDGELTIGAEEVPSRGETLRFAGEARQLTAAGNGFYCYHSVIIGLAEKGAGVRIRHVNGKAVVRNSLMAENISIVIEGGVGSRYDLTVKNSRFERCASPLLLCSMPRILSGITFRSCGALSVHRNAVLQDCVFENMPVQYAEVGRWRGGEGTTLTLINCTPWTNFPAAPLFFQGSRVVRKEYLRVRVVDAGRRGIEGARVTVKDEAAGTEVEALSDGEGYARAADSRDIPLTMFIHDADGARMAGPHRVAAAVRGVERTAMVSMSEAVKDRPVEATIIIPAQSEKQQHNRR